MEDVSMTKAELIDAVASNVGISKKAAAEAVDSVFGNITKALKRGGKYTHVGFGTFSVVKRAAREGRNPQSGATIRIPARNVVKFTAGKALKESV
jgi:DNA-binding protein HU-beta